MSEINTNTTDHPPRPSLIERIIADPNKAGNRVGLTFVLALLLPYLYEVATSPESEVATVNPRTSVTVEENPPYGINYEDGVELRETMNNFAQAVIKACETADIYGGDLTCGVSVNGESMQSTDDITGTGPATVSVEYTDGDGNQRTASADTIVIDGEIMTAIEGGSSVESVHAGVEHDGLITTDYVERQNGNGMKVKREAVNPETGAVSIYSTDPLDPATYTLYYDEATDSVKAMTDATEELNRILQDPTQ